MENLLKVLKVLFLSTPSARRATYQLYKGYRGPKTISIHALREEGDLLRSQPATLGTLISIHALREEGDVMSLSLSTR